MSTKWMLAQMKHQVFAEATNAFWDLAFQFVPPTLQQQTKRVPKFVQRRKKMLLNHCPEVHLEYSYRNKVSGEIINYKGSTAPIKLYQNNQNYEKLYELAYVKVNTNDILLHFFLTTFAKSPVRLISRKMNVYHFAF